MPPAEPIHIPAAVAKLMFLALEAGINELHPTYDQRDAACAACLHELTLHGATVEFGSLPADVDPDVIDSTAIEEV